MLAQGLRRFWFAPLLLLSACASTPEFDTSRVDPTLTPRAAVTELPANRGKTVLWGGVILHTANLAKLTRLEVLAYPLDGDRRPRRDRDPLGRFLIERQGFLEPATYAEGRLLTVVGTLSGSEDGKVGGSAYVYPVIEAGQLHLWPKDSDYDRGRSNVHFGIGVGIGL